MSSREYTEYHLTPNGWVKGTTQTDFNRIERPVPPDRVLTQIYEEFLSSGYSPMDKTVGTIWSKGEGELEDELLRKFGPCPGGI